MEDSSIQGRGLKWDANVSIALMDNGAHRVTIFAYGDTSPDAKEGAETIMAQLASGKRCVVRQWPIPQSETDHKTGETKHRCTARFYYFDEPGAWEEMKDEASKLWPITDNKGST